MMHDAVKLILAQFNLTPRETDIVIALVDGQVTTRDLSRHLRIAESTVQNHFDNISTKTGLAGKTDLLVYVVQKAFQMLENARFFIVTPSVLVLDDHADIADGLSILFRDRGCRASAAYDVREELVQRIIDERIDLLVCDVQIGGDDGLEFLRLLQSRVPEPPSIVVISADDVNASRRQDYVSAYLRKPLDPRALFESSVDAVIGRERKTGRNERMTLDAKVSVDGQTGARTYEIGTGGMAISSGEDGRFDAGRPVSFELELPEKTVIRGEGVTVWSKPEAGSLNDSRIAGIRFSRIDDEHRRYLIDYVRTKNILKFLPIDRVLQPIGKKAV